MKKFVLFSMMFITSFMVFSQTPQSFRYQTVVRDANGYPVTDRSVNFQISIISGASTGNVEYVETHSDTTNDFGLVSLAVGEGTIVSGSFAGIDWASADHFIKVEIDTTGGTVFTDMGTTQLLSVPYALYAAHTGSSGNSLWEANGNDIYNNNPGKVGVGTTSPPAKMVVQGDSTMSDTIPLFEVKDRNGATVFIVYPDSVRIYVKDDGTKTNKGAFAVSGRNTAKQPTNDFLVVTPDSSRIYTSDPDAGFGVRNIGLNDKTSYLHLIPDNYFIGHESGQQVTSGYGNTFFGYQSGFSDVTGSDNVFIGQYSGYSNTSGINNIFIGNLSGTFNTVGNFNICLGNEAGRSLDTAVSNVFIGDMAGYHNNFGNYNTLIGDMAGYYNTSGLNNIFIGASSGQSNTIGSYNICLGNEAGYSLDTAVSNVFIGTEAGYSNSYGSYNTFIGESAGINNSTGIYNVFLGASSGYSNTTGGFNICLGNEAGYFLDTAHSNIFIGTEAGYSNTFGNDNTFIGEQAGLSNTTGDENIFLGNRTGFMNLGGDGNIFIGSEAGNYNITGHYNIFIGEGSGYNNTGDIADSSLGSGNVFLGQGSGFLNVIGESNNFMGSACGFSNYDGTDNNYFGRQAGENNNGSYNVFIGAEAGRLLTNEESKLWIDSRDVTIYQPPLIYGEFDNRIVVIDGDAASNINDRTFFVNGSAGGTGAWFNDSDLRLKKNVVTIQSALAKTLQLRGVNFEWIDNEKREKGIQMGFIAQEVEKVIPEVISNSNDHYSMSYAPVTALLVEAIKEQQTMIEQQQKIIEEQQKEIESIRDKMNDLELTVKK